MLHVETEGHVVSALNEQKPVLQYTYVQIFGLTPTLSIPPERQREWVEERNVIKGEAQFMHRELSRFGKRELTTSFISCPLSIRPILMIKTLFIL